VKVAGVSILIPTHNRCDILDRTLESLQALVLLRDVQVEAIVVNNVCTDRTDEVVKAWIPRSKIPLRLVHESAIGLNNARNRAVREAKYDLLAFLDDDVLVDPEWLAGLIRTFETTDASLVGGKVELWWEAVPRPAWMIPDLEDHLSRLDFGDQIKFMSEPQVVGANFAFTRKVFEDAGEFRPDLDRKGKSLLSGGETDFILKAMAAPHLHKLYYSPLASLRHWVPPHRAELGHLLKIIEGKNAALVLMRERYGLMDVARSVVGGLGKIARHGPVAAMCGMTERGIRAKMRCAVGRGQIGGAMTRMRRAR
jgi:glycosyltransferase involved in cell wall biosynthesis